MVRFRFRLSDEWPTHEVALILRLHVRQKEGMLSSTNWVKLCRTDIWNVFFVLQFFQDLLSWICFFRFLFASAIFRRPQVSFGSVNSLGEMPCTMSHASIPAEERTLPADLVRLSVGIEDVRDLLQDRPSAAGIEGTCVATGPSPRLQS